MNNKNIQLFESILESGEERQELPDGITEQELKASAAFDEVLKEAISQKPLPSSKLDSFTPFKKARKHSLPNPVLFAAAGIVLIAIAVTYFMMVVLQEAPKADPAELSAARNKALNTAALPQDLQTNQAEYVSLLADNYGDFRTLDSNDLQDELHDAWKASCASYESKQLEEIKSLETAGEKLERIEALVDTCSGQVSSETVTLYQESLASSKQLLEAALDEWRSGGSPDLEWATKGWEPAKRLFVNATSADKRKVWLSFRAFVDGAAYDDLVSTYSKVPRHLLLPLAELASLVIARELSLNPELNNSKLLSNVTDHFTPLIEKEDLNAISSSGIFSVNPLYSAFYFAPGSLTPKLRRAIGNVDNFFKASQQYLSRNRIDARPIVTPLLSSFSSSATFVIAKNENYSAYRYNLLAQNALNLEGEQQKEYTDFLARVNFFRFSAGLPLISTVFHHPEGAQTLNPNATSLRSDRPDAKVFQVFLLSADINRCHPVFFGDSPVIKLYLFKEDAGVSLPDNYLNRDKQSSAISMPSGDSENNF